MLAGSYLNPLGRVEKKNDKANAYANDCEDGASAQDVGF
jgi:hypothetical protein